MMSRASLWHSVMLYGGIIGVATLDDPKYIAASVLASCAGLIMATEEAIRERLDRQEAAIQRIWEQLHPSIYQDSDYPS